MVKCLTRTRRIGDSLIVTLPKELVKTQKIKENELLEINVKKCRRKALGPLKGIKPFTVEDEFKTLE